MKKTITFCLLLCLTLSCGKITNQEERDLKTITLTSIKNLDISELFKMNRKILEQNQIISYDEFEVRREIDGLEGDYSARIVTLAPENNFVSDYHILEPSGFETYCSMKVEEISPNNYYAKYYSPEGILFMEATLCGDLVTVICVYEDLFDLSKNSNKNFFRRFRDCAFATASYITSDPYLSAIYVIGARVAPHYILAGLAIGCAAYSIF